MFFFKSLQRCHANLSTRCVRERLVASEHVGRMMLNFFIKPATMASLLLKPNHPYKNVTKHLPYLMDCLGNTQGALEGQPSERQEQFFKQYRPKCTNISIGLLGKDRRVQCI